MKFFGRKRAQSVSFLAIALSLSSCASGFGEPDSSRSGSVGEEQTVNEAREDGCQAALLIVELNSEILQDIDALLAQGFSEWTEVYEDVWAKGDLVADHGSTFYRMGLQEDTAFRTAGVNVARAYEQFSFAGFNDAGARWSDASDHFRESSDQLNGAILEFADFCPE